MTRMLIACAAMLASGCGSTLTLTSFCEADTDAWLPVVVGCGFYSASVEGEVRASTIADCQRFAPALKDGRVTFDSNKAQRCLDLERKVTCTSAFFDGCNPEDLVIGQVTMDGGCFDSAECVRGAFCDFSNEQCPGVCSPRVASGQPSSDTFRCIEGTYLYGRVCFPFVKEGASCAAYQPLSAMPQTCARGSRCDARQSICMPLAERGALGSSCTANRDCGYSYCNAGVCTAYAGLGEACTRPLRCKIDLACGVDGLCIEVPVGLGEPCEGFGCKEGLYCQHDAGVCATQLTEGESCGFGSAACLPPLRCSTPYQGSGTCGPAVEIGGACVTQGQCVSDWCDDGVCKRARCDDPTP